jgi:DNA-binding MarR family transcriptional regulator
VFETLMRDLVGHDHRPAAFLVYLALAASSDGKPLAWSHQQLADRTGLSKRAVQDAISHLGKRGLLKIERRARTEPAILKPLKPWLR